MSKFSDKFVDGMSLVAEKVPWCNQGFVHHLHAVRYRWLVL
jgi:hypothetical protein